MTAANGREISLAVVGAAGAVGLQLAELIGERNVLGANLTLLGSPEGSVTEVDVGGESTSVAPLTSVEVLKDFDFVFLALPADAAAAIVAANPGPTVIDLSAASRMPGAAPIVAPGLTPRERFRELRSSKLFAPPHPAAQTIANVLHALEVRSGFVGATVILSASASGREAVSALFEQSVELLNARLELGDNETQKAFNVLQPEGSADLAAAIAAQSAALLAPAPTLAVGIMQAAAFHGCGVSLSLPAAATNAATWPERLRVAPGVIVSQSAEAVNFVGAAGQEAVLVKLNSGPASATLWCVFDAPRLIALSAIWIAESIVAADT